MKMNMEIKFIVSLIFSVLVAIFAIQNAGNVDINFLFAKFTVSQAVVILGSTILGAVIVVLLSLIKQIKQTMKIKQLTKEVASLTEEKNKLQAKLEESIMNTDQKESPQINMKEEMNEDFYIEDKILEEKGEQGSIL